MTPHPASPTDPATRAALADLRDRMLADVLPDYADGLLDGDSTAKSAVEELLCTNAEARAFLKDYRSACASRTAMEWNALADRVLTFVHSDDHVEAPSVTSLPDLTQNPSLALSESHEPSRRVTAAYTGDAIANRIPALADTLSSESATQHDAKQLREGGGTPSGQVIRKRQWLSGLLGDLPLLTSSAFALHGRPETERQVWRLDLSQIGLPEEERRARVPWAGGVVQISQSTVADGLATYFAYIEPTDDPRPHGVLLITLHTPDDQTCKVRLTKRGPKKKFSGSVLPANSTLLHFAVAIE